MRTGVVSGGGGVVACNAAGASWWKTHTASRTEYGAFALPVTVIDDEGAALRIRLEVEPKQMMEDAGPTMVAVKAVLTGGVRQSNTMVTVTVEERDEEYLVSPALFELEIPAGETSVDDEFMLTPIDDDEVEEDLLIGITGVNGSDGIPVDGTEHLAAGKVLHPGGASALVVHDVRGDVEPGPGSAARWCGATRRSASVGLGRSRGSPFTRAFRAGGAVGRSPLCGCRCGLVSCPTAVDDDGIGKRRRRGKPRQHPSRKRQRQASCASREPPTTA